MKKKKELINKCCFMISTLWKPQKSYFSGPTTEALTPPPPSSIVVLLFLGTFLKHQQKIFFHNGPAYTPTSS